MGFQPSFGRSASGIALVALGLTLPVPALVMAQTLSSFSDIQSHWARPFIQTLAQNGLISGFGDRTFQPDQSISRDQFNSILNQVFSSGNVSLSQGFDSSAANYWSSFNFQANRPTPPEQLRGTDNVSRLQVILAITKGLGLTPRNNPQTTLGTYQDASRIPQAAADGLAAATENGLVVNYPDVQFFDPNKPATRAEVAAFIYQALVNQGVLDPISNRNTARYIVPSTGVSTANNPNPSNSSNSSSPSNSSTQSYGNRVAMNTLINIRYPQAQKIVLTPGESQSLTLLVADNIINTQGQVLIPRDSQIVGQLTSRFNGGQFAGAQFVAQTLIIGDRSYPINASSRLITGQSAEAVRQQGGIGDAVISTAAQTILGSVIGGNRGFGLEGILGSILGGGNSSAPNPNTGNQLVIINPVADLQLTTQSELAIGN
jgi:hypothetical protein